MNPIFATLYALVIFGLIFNTVFSLYYALGKRFSAGSEKRFKFFVDAFALAGFCYFLHGLPSTGSGYVSYYRLFRNADVGSASCG